MSFSKTYSKYAVATIGLYLLYGFGERVFSAMEHYVRVLSEHRLGLACNEIGAVLCHVLALRHNDKPFHPVGRHVAVLGVFGACLYHVKILLLYGAM